MLKFEIYLELKEDLNKEVSINGFKFNVFRTDIGDISILVYIRPCEVVKEGVCIHADKVYLTNDDRDVFNSKVIALRVDSFVVISKDVYQPSRRLYVKTNGKTMRSICEDVKLVGVEKRAFFARFIKIQNEERRSFSMLAVGFNRIAYQLKDLSEGVFVNISAYMQKNKKSGRLELQVIDIETVSGNR